MQFARILGEVGINLTHQNCIFVFSTPPVNFLGAVIAKSEH
jgi:hypothetical protein